MKLQTDSYVYEAPGISIIPETEFEAAVLCRYWKTAKLSVGRANSAINSSNGCAYSIKFTEPEDKHEKA